MNNVSIIPAQLSHIDLIIPFVRWQDIDEFYAMSLMTPDQVIYQGIRLSTQCWSGFINDEMVTIFGVTPFSMLGGKGIPWLVGTIKLDRYAKTFIKHCRPMLDEMLTIYPKLENYVDERNVKAKQWLRWLGFKLDESQPVGKLGMPFHRFTMEKQDV